MKLKGKITDVSLDFITHKPKLTIQLTSQEDILTDEFNNLQDEELLDITLVKHRERRSNDANAYFHTLVNKLARYYNLSDEEMKIKMNLQYGTIAVDDNGKIMGAKVPKNVDLKSFYPYSKWYKEQDGCDCYLFYKRTHTLNKLEFSQLINGVDQECKDVGIPTLNDLELQRLIDSYEASNSK